MMSDVVASTYNAQDVSTYVPHDVWFSGIWICTSTWWYLIFCVPNMELIWSNFLTAGYVADDVWLSCHLELCCRWCLNFWHLDIKLRMSHFLAIGCVPHDVWFPGIYICSWWCLLFWHLISSNIWWCLIFFLLDMYLMMSTFLRAKYVADDDSITGIQIWNSACLLS